MGHRTRLACGSFPTRSPRGWVRRGQDVMNTVDGCLGSGLVHRERDSPVWHMVYRFADEATCRAWEDSRARAAIVVVMPLMVCPVLPAVTRMDEPWLQRGRRETD